MATISVRCSLFQDIPCWVNLDLGIGFSFADSNHCSVITDVTSLVVLLFFLYLEITKLLTKISREKGNEEFQPWIKPCERHLYWSATSTIDGCGKVIYAKFRSFLSHIINKHTELDDPLFNKCAHGDIPDRKWIDPGIVFSYFKQRNCPNFLPQVPAAEIEQTK